MEGSGIEPDCEDRGMIPRAVEQIFEFSRKLGNEKGWEFSMSVTYIEIYNETIRDLLGNPNNSQIKHEIKHDSTKGKTTVTEANIGIFSLA